MRVSTSIRNPKRGVEFTAGGDRDEEKVREASPLKSAEPLRMPGDVKAPLLSV